MTEQTTKRILVIRHGQTAWNSDGRWQGVTQIPLNDVGIAQAHQLAQHLKDRPIKAIYTSDLIRASETARIIADVHQLPVHEDQRWRELNLGEFQGLTYAQIVERYPDAAYTMKHNYMDFAAPSGEPRRAMQDRVYQAFMEIARSDTQPEIAVVTHGGAIRVLLIKLFDGHPEAAVPIENTSITIIETDGEHHTLVGAAAVEHLNTTPKQGGDDISSP